MRVLSIIAKDLGQILRDWKSALFLVIMPVLFTAFFAFILDPVYRPEPEQDSRLPVGWYEEPSGSKAPLPDLRSLLATSEVVRLEDVDTAALEDAAKRVAEGELAALVRVPAGYAEALLSGADAALTVVSEAGTPAGGAALRAVETAAARLGGAVQAARISADLYAERSGFASSEDRQTYLAAGVERAVSAWADPPLAVEVSPLTAGDSGEEPVMTGLIQASSGMMIQFAVFGLITAAMVLVLERKSGALQRLQASPVSSAGIIAGHMLAMFGVILAQQIILVLVGQFVFGVDYLRAPGAVLLMIGALALWAASLGLLISAVSRREEQVVVFSLVAMFLFSALGGAWFPLEVAGKTFAAIGRFMPTAWAIEGFQNVILRDLGVRAVLRPAGVVLLYASGFFLLAVWRFSARTAPGVGLRAAGRPGGPEQPQK